MGKVFFVLYLAIGFGSNQTVALDHYDTWDECNAARNALVMNTKEWYYMRVTDENSFCFKAQVTGAQIR